MMSFNDKLIRDPDFDLESEILGKEINIDALQFNFIMTSFIEFVCAEIINENYIGFKQVDKDIKQKFKELIYNAKEYCTKDAIASETEGSRIEAWKLHDSLPNDSTAKDIAELVVLCVYDKESAEYNTFGPEPMIESIMTSFARLGPDFCRKYRLFLKRKMLSLPNHHN